MRCRKLLLCWQAYVDGEDRAAAEVSLWNISVVVCQAVQDSIFRFESRQMDGLPLLLKG
jgi:hypothetical protein